MALNYDPIIYQYPEFQSTFGWTGLQVDSFYNYGVKLDGRKLLFLMLVFLFLTRLFLDCNGAFLGSPTRKQGFVYDHGLHVLRRGWIRSVRDLYLSRNLLDVWIGCFCFFRWGPRRIRWRILQDLLWKLRSGAGHNREQERRFLNRILVHLLRMGRWRIVGRHIALLKGHR